MTDDAYYLETPRFVRDAKTIQTRKSHKNAVLAERGIFKCCFTPLRSFADMDPPLTVRRFHSRGAVYLSDNAALVPNPLYYMSSLYSSIDRPKRYC